MRLLRRSLALLAPVVIVIAVLFPNVRHVRREFAVKQTLLTLQSALQDFHVDQERYVPRMQLKGGELITVLLDRGFLKQMPFNPYTGRPYSLRPGEVDRIIYRTDEAFETYALEALHFGNDEVWLEIDSVQHQSLE